LFNTFIKNDVNNVIKRIIYLYLQLYSPKECVDPRVGSVDGAEVGATDGATEGAFVGNGVGLRVG
jgi:hypothetical protein